MCSFFLELITNSEAPYRDITIEAEESELSQSQHALGALTTTPTFPRCIHRGLLIDCFPWRANSQLSSRRFQRNELISIPSPQKEISYQTLPGHYRARVKTIIFSL